MPVPSQPKGPAQTVLRYGAGLSALPYLLVLFLVQSRYPGGALFLLCAAIGPLAAATFFAAFLRARSRDDRVPDPVLLLVWGGITAMEIHALVPPVARSGIVPAALFFCLALRFPPTASIPAILCAGAWLAAVPGPFAQEILYTSAMALIAGAGGFAVRGGRLGRGREADRVQDAIARSRVLVLPWEESGNGGLPAGGEMTEDSSLLRRNEELKDGIRRALEGLLPLTGAGHVGYLARSASPGTVLHEGILLGGGSPVRSELKDGIRRALEGLLPLTGAGHVGYLARSASPGTVLHEGILLGGGSPVPRVFSVPDTYVPVREATVFRKSFLEVGPGAGRYAPWKSGPGSAPTGIAAVPVFREGVVEGVLLALRDEEGP